MEFSLIQFIVVIIFSIVVMGKNYSNESELLKFPALNQSMSSENVSETGVLEEGFEAKGQLISKVDLKVFI
jgi:hypothetical protein